MELSLRNRTQTRNRTKTTQRIIEALEEVIDEYGWEEVNVSRITQKAGVSKVLIYRYFGGLEGLIIDYVKMGKLFPVLTPTELSQLNYVEKSDLAHIWYQQVIRTYRSFRGTKSAREVLKATLIENDTMADAISKAVDEEITRLVEQLSFVKGADTQAISAVILGGMSYLTIMAQINRTVVGLDLRSEKDWKRIESAIKMLYTALNQLVIASEETTVQLPEFTLPTHWL